jgi:transposase
VRLYKRFRSVDKVAAMIGISTGSVRRFVRAAGILQGRGRPRIKTPPVDTIREMHERYGNGRDVADILGVSRSTVYNRMTEKK